MCFKIEGHPALELSKIKIILCSSLGATIFLNNQHMDFFLFNLNGKHKHMNNRNNRCCKTPIQCKLNCK